jgi:hypothetical protein
MTTKMKLGTVITGILLAWLSLVVTNAHVLVHEIRVHPGETLKLADWGDVTGDSLICKYFTGRKFVSTVFNYAPNNIMGKDQCPFLDFP